MCLLILNNSPVGLFLHRIQTIVKCRMQERVGMGVLVIVFALDGFPISCFKLKFIAL